MRRAGWVGVLVGLAAVGVVWAGSSLWRNARDSAAFDEQMRLARAEGIPTTPAEFAATLPTVAAKDNAAPVYQRLPKRIETGDGLADEVTFRATPESLSAARALLSKQERLLATLDEATELPACRFERDWSLGAAVLFPEYATMKQAARLLCLRGSVAAHAGRSSEAIGDVRRAFRIADHAAGEGHALAFLVGRGIRAIGLQQLAGWAFAHPEEPAYRKELALGIEALRPPRLKDLHREDLISVLSMIDLCATPEGRAQLGLREEDLGRAESIFPRLIRRSSAKVRVVEAMRERWRALDAPSDEVGKRWDEANSKLWKAMLAFPTAATVYEALGSGVGPVEEAQSIEARRQLFVALGRALAAPAIPAGLDTSDLRSPYDGTPLVYRYDGKRLSLSVMDGDKAATQMKLPRARPGEE